MLIFASAGLYYDQIACSLSDGGWEKPST